MYKYTAKTLFTGYKLGLKNANLYVGIPKKHFEYKTHLRLPVESDEHCVGVSYAGEFQMFYVGKEETKRTFNDKFRPGKTYTLLYFLWKKVSEEALEDENK